jgi:NitT/TauT family transport system substrate-binding protein
MRDDERSTTRRRVIEALLLAGGLAGAEGLGFAAAARGQKPQRFKVTYASATSGGPLWLAHEQGRFQANGLDPELLFITGTTAVVQSTLSGESPISYAAAPAMIAAAVTGVGLVIVAGAVNTLVYDLVVNPSITRPEDLKGKAIGVTRFGASSDFGIRLVLERAWGLSADRDVTIRQLGDNRAIISGLQAGIIQAAPLTADGRLKAEKLGFKTLVDLGGLGIDYQHTAVFTSRDFITQHEDTVRRFIRAFVEGIHLFRTDKARALAALAKYAKTNDRELLEAYYAEYANVFPKVPYPTLTGIQVILDEIAHRTPEARKFKPEDFVDLHFVRELEASGYIDRLYRGG